MAATMQRSRHDQRGATLTIAMIMLVLLTLFVLAAINMSSINLRIMGNEQARSESVAAAQQAIEQVISTNFPAAPPAPQTVTVDINGGGTTYTVNVPTPVCQNSVPIKLVELDATSALDQPCFGSATSSSPGVSGAASSGDSFCAATQWDVSGTATDNSGANATVTLHQGVGQRVPIGTTC
jgi:Tfp pilus assembly protein PilX